MQLLPSSVYITSFQTSHDLTMGAVLFGFVYSLAYTPLQALYPAECLDYNTRFDITLITKMHNF